MIETKSGNPHKDKVRRCPEKWRGDINEQINEMSKNGIIKESSSPYSSNIVLVNKKDGSKRFCVDYRTLNNSTVKDTYPLPKVDDLLEQTRGAKYFLQQDLAAGYWGIPIDPKDSKKQRLHPTGGNSNLSECRLGSAMHKLRFKESLIRFTSWVTLALMPMWIIF